MKKKVWAKPEFIVLAKSTPGENILTSCKSVNHASSYLDGSASSGQNCKARAGCCGACQNEGGKGDS
jgi:hypothetical protein